MYKTKEEIKMWLDKKGVTNYIINQDLTVNVNGDVSIGFMSLKSIDVQFKKVTGNFYCNNNFLTSLQGCPQSVGGNFKCHTNQLATLEFSPEKVHVDFVFSGNPILSLIKRPCYVGGIFIGHNINISSLEGLPDFYGSFKISLKSKDKLKELESLYDVSGNEIWLTKKQYHTFKFSHTLEKALDDINSKNKKNKI